ncbi:MAG: class I SAM-dependent methyltransferase [Pseudonocardiaceae bacterium]
MTEYIDQRSSGEPSQDTWQRWLRRYDGQQQLYIEARERRFDVMFSLLEDLLPAEITVLDLMAGPGAVSERLLSRMPVACSVAVDVDPVLLRLGRNALGDGGGRLRWVRADVIEPAWVDELGQDRFDAVLSCTALHWLPAPDMARVYQQLAQLLAPGGVLISGDLLPLPAHLRRIRAAVRSVDRRRQKKAADNGAQTWDQWWDALRGEPSLRAEFAERDRRWPPGSVSGREAPGQAFHEAALVEAGFADVAVIWQDLEERLLLALR